LDWRHDVHAVDLAPSGDLPIAAAAAFAFDGGCDGSVPLVWLSIAALLITGTGMLMAVGMKAAPIGWHVMLGIGLLMFALFGHVYFGPFKRLKLAVAASDWPEAGRRLGQIQAIVKTNFVLGWLAIAAVLFLH
jgi:uncharacterized membrane protein